MTRYTRAFLTLALIAFACSQNASPWASAQNRASSNTSATQPARSVVTWQNSRVKTIQFESRMVGRTLPYNVLLPVDYNQRSARTRRYPVLYLLHGLTGHYTNWLEFTHLADYTRPYDLIIIMPEGNDGWYTDSATMPTDKYESYILRELIPDVERRFRVRTTRDGRAIAGLSMGGYGALKFGVKYPELFAFAGSMSGALGAASWTQEDLRGLEFIWRTLVTVFGPEDNPMRKANDVSKLYREVPASRIGALPFVYLDCGTDDPLLSSSRSLMTILLERKISHEYRQLPGTHAWSYWDAQVQEVLRIATRKLREPAAKIKSTVSFREGTFPPPPGVV
jgi:putative tributyrin esterase